MRLRLNVFYLLLSTLLFCTMPKAGWTQEAETKPPTMQANALHNDQPYASLHLGLLLTQHTGLDAAIDITLPSVHLLPGFVTRVDADLLAPFDAPSFLGLPDTRFDLLLCQTCYFSSNVGKRFYAGGGLGISFGEITQFGSKVYVGKEFTRVVGLEAGLHLPAAQDPAVTFQLRIGL